MQGGGRVTVEVKDLRNRSTENNIAENWQAYEMKINRNFGN